MGAALGVLPGGAAAWGGGAAAQSFCGGVGSHLTAAAARGWEGGGTRPPVTGSTPLAATHLPQRASEER
jgi:hypothetical protein